jgi:hypothetical protein
MATSLRCKPEDIRKTAEPVTLEGYQAVMKESKYGYSLTAIIDENMLQTLAVDRPKLIDWCLTKVSNPKRAVCKPEPWEEVAEGKYKVKFSWNNETKPGVVDSNGTEIIDEEFPLFGGAKVKLAFFQKPYILPDQTYGTSLKLLGVQVIDIGSEAGTSGSASSVDTAKLFEAVDGFVYDEKQAPEVDDDF